MKLKTKITIDRYFGLPIVYLLNAMARMLGFLLKINHSLEKPVKTIAVCKFVGLGSIIQSTPLLETLRKNYPHASIIFITNKGNKMLLQNFKYIDKVYTVSDNSFTLLIKTSIGLLFSLWKEKITLYIDLEIYSNYSSVIATMSLATNRMGYFKNDKMYRKGIYTHMMYFNIKSPVSQAYLQFARLINCKEIIDSLSIISVDEEIKNSAFQKLNIEKQDKYIVINPNASDLRLERRWHANNYIFLINQLIKNKPSFKIILIGDKSEVLYADAIESNIDLKGIIINSAGKLSLNELVAVIENADLVITNDTGPMHIAFAMRTKTIALFGPCAPQQYGGMENTYTIYKNVYCSPCVHEFIIPPCKGDNQCMQKISVLEVLNMVNTALSNEGNMNESLLLKNKIDYTNSKFEPLGIVIR